jgi:hypothetical protein
MPASNRTGMTDIVGPRHRGRRDGSHFCNFMEYLQMTVVTSIKSVKSTAAAEVTKAESWLQKYLTQWLIGAAIGAAIGVAATHFVIDKIWK